MNDVDDILVAALVLIAGETGVQGSPQEKIVSPCAKDCQHADCRAARALFAWRRRRSIDAIGEHKRS